MRALLQCVSQACVRIEGEKHSKTGPGLMILLGVGKEDDTQAADKLWNKISKLRIFEDEQGKTNLSIQDIKGEVMVVSQFTLFAQCRKGLRPSFSEACPPKEAKELYEYFCSLVKNTLGDVKTGVFGAMMDVELTNHGPFTIWLDTDDLA